MSVLNRPTGDLYYEAIDLVPPWQTTRETILFVNGLAIDADIWVTWLPTLVDRYRIVRTDLRGFGRSFRPEPGAEWSMSSLAQDVLDVLDATDTPRVHFVGESTGGTLGLYLALEHHDRLTSVTTVSAAHAGGAIGQAQALRDDVLRLGMDAWSEQVMAKRFHPGALSDEMYAWFHDTQRQSTPHCCVDLVDMLVATDLTDRIADIRIPTLILAPDDSPFVAVEQQLERLRAIPDSRLEVIANSRHGVSHSHGRECADALRRFLDTL
ncbi:MAG: alpha/beta hydrolase [Pseudomonadota bacterium]